MDADFFIFRRSVHREKILALSVYSVVKHPGDF